MVKVLFGLRTVNRKALPTGKLAATLAWRFAAAARVVSNSRVVAISMERVTALNGGAARERDG
jgi:hypothetical protein